MVSFFWCEGKFCVNFYEYYYILLIVNLKMIMFFFLCEVNLKFFNFMFNYIFLLNFYMVWNKNYFVFVDMYIDKLYIKVRYKKIFN